MNVRGDGFAAGRFTEVVPGRRLVFTWGWEAADRGVPPGWPPPPPAPTRARTPPWSRPRTH
jgi:uncharacterized protein YndB with AHSA1/START domain